jgi:hypothetical protein
VRHVTDAGKRLAAKAVGANIVKVLKRSELARSKTLAYNLEVIALHVKGQATGECAAR